jgi:hypothetical protein
MFEDALEALQVHLKEPISSIIPNVSNEPTLGLTYGRKPDIPVGRCALN